MTSLRIGAALTVAAFVALPVLAAGDALPPPQIQAVQNNPARSGAAVRDNRQTPPKEAENEAGRLEPTEADYRQARARAEQRRASEEKITRYEGKYGTRIDEYHDQNNRMTEVVVTPGTTHIPYTMENRTDRPINTEAGGNPGSTLGTPKFFKHSW